MSQQGTGKREANQTKHAEYVTSEGHPRSLVLLGGVLQVGLSLGASSGLPSFLAERPLRLRSCPSYNTPPCEVFNGIDWRRISTSAKGLH